MRNYTENLKRFVGALAISTLCLFPVYGQDQASAHQQLAAVEEPDGLRSNLDIAHAQHEIILLYIKNDQWDKVWPAAQLLLSLKFPAEQEEATVRSLTIITEELYKKGQSALVHQVLSAATKSVGDNSNKAKVYLIQARSYKRDGLDEKAIECFKKFQDLSSKSPE